MADPVAMGETVPNQSPAGAHLTLRWSGGWLGVIRDDVHGNVNVSDNHSNFVQLSGETGPVMPGTDGDSTEVMTNKVHGDLVCWDNTPSAQVNTGDFGQPNDVHGSKLGECAGL